MLVLAPVPVAALECKVADRATLSGHSGILLAAELYSKVGAGVALLF